MTTEDGPLSREKVAAYIAEQEQGIEVLKATVERLETLADDERREQYRKESQLTAFRALVEQRGLVDP